MTPSDGIMDRLRAGTVELHKRAESRPLQQHLGAGTLPQDIYAAYAGQLLLVHESLERSLDLQVVRHSHPAFVAAWQSLARHSENLRQDLREHGLDPMSIAPLDATASLLEQLDAWSGSGDLALIGALYVLEGSMNGNRFIRKSLQRAYGRSDGAGLTYLDPYGEQQRPTWLAFRDRVNDVALNAQQCDRIMDGANRMFEALGEISDEQFDIAAA